jgi:hypothetical protein
LLSKITAPYKTNFLEFLFRKQKQARLMPIILATWEAENRTIAVPGQHRQKKSSQDPI